MFQHVGQLPAKLVASWDGTSWKAMDIPFEGQVKDLIIFNGDLLACGRFDCGDGMCWLLKWDGETWTPLGDQTIEGEAYKNEAVQMLVHDDSLYVAGEFGPFEHPQIMLHWDGTSWKPLELASPGYDWVGVNCATVFEGRITVGGASGPHYRYGKNPFVMQWDGADWDTLSIDISDKLGPSGGVFALAVQDGRLFAGGQFADSSKVFPNGVGVWNGQEWQRLGSGLDIEPGPVGRDGSGESVFTLFFWAGKLYAGGYIQTTSDSQTLNGVAVWNGSQWQPMGSGLEGYALEFGEFEGNLVVAGGFNRAGECFAKSLALWNGHGWLSPFPTALGLDGYVLSIASYRDGLAMGGQLQSAGRLRTQGVALWNGISWSPLGDGINGRVNALVSSGDTLFVGGLFTAAGGESAANVARWTGEQWEALGAGLSGEVFALCIYKGSLYAGGEFSLSTTECCIARWDGAAWRGVGGSFKGSSNYSVYALDTFNGQLIAGGWFWSISPPNIHNLARWNGIAWQSLGGTPDAGVTCLVQYKSRLIVGGHFASIERYPLASLHANRIASWDGSTWQSLGIGLDGEPEDLDVFDDLLIAGGMFRRAGMNFASSVAAWNGSVWEPFGSGVSNQVHAVRSWREHVFFGGLFGTAGGTPSSCVARLDLEPLTPSSTAFQAHRERDGVRLTWQTSGSGRSFQVLRQAEETLVLPYEISSSAEYFDQDAPDTPVRYWLGEIESGTIVGWLGPATVPAREFRFAFAPAFPNPFTGTLRFTVEIPKSEQVTLRVYDLAGREVARLLEGFTPAGEYQLSWNGKDRSGTPLAAGIFFVRLDSPSGHRVQKVVKLRP